MVSQEERSTICWQKASLLKTNSTLLKAMIVSFLSETSRSYVAALNSKDKGKKKYLMNFLVEESLIWATTCRLPAPSTYSQETIKKEFNISLHHFCRNALKTSSKSYLKLSSWQVEAFCSKDLTPDSLKKFSSFAQILTCTFGVTAIKVSKLIWRTGKVQELQVQFQIFKTVCGQKINILRKARKI